MNPLFICFLTLGCEALRFKVHEPTLSLQADSSKSRLDSELQANEKLSQALVSSTSPRTCSGMYAWAGPAKYDSCDEDPDRDFDTYCTALPMPASCGNDNRCCQDLCEAEPWSTAGDCCQYNSNGRRCYMCDAPSRHSNYPHYGNLFAVMCTGRPEVSTTGDPHTQNVKGESFDIRREGSVVLLRMADNSSEKLRVTGLVQRLGPFTCGHLYYTQVAVSGTWLNGKTIKVKKSANSSQDFVLTVDGNEIQLPAIGEGDSSKEHIVMEEKNGESTFAVTVAPSTHIPLDARKRAFKVKVAGMTLQIETRLGFKFLDIYAFHLGEYAKTIGGIIGNDDHSEWTLASKECQATKSFSHPHEPDASVAIASP